jgi:Mg2+/Co2+ transporter CorC
VNDDVSRILTKQDLERINTNPEFIKALKMIINHASFIPQGKTILTKLHRQLPQSIKGMK